MATDKPFKNIEDPVGKTLPIILGFNWSLCDFCVFVKKALVTIANYAITTRAN